MIYSKITSKERTERKLKFARIHLDELKQYNKVTSNDDWENAHQESFLFHLIGSVENLLHEINLYYSLNIDYKKITWEKVEKELVRLKIHSPAFDFINTLRNDKNNWLYLLNEMRNNVTHNGRLTKVVNFSGDNEFKDPRYNEPQKIYPGLKCLELNEKMYENVKQLIQDCRKNDPLINE